MPIKELRDGETDLLQVPIANSSDDTLDITAAGVTMEVWFAGTQIADSDITLVGPQELHVKLTMNFDAGGEPRVEVWYTDADSANVVAAGHYKVESSQRG